MPGETFHVLTISLEKSKCLSFREFLEGLDLVPQVLNRFSVGFWKVLSNTRWLEDVFAMVLHINERETLVIGLYLA